MRITHLLLLLSLFFSADLDAQRKRKKKAEPTPPPASLSMMPAVSDTLFERLNLSLRGSLEKEEDDCEKRKQRKEKLEQRHWERRCWPQGCQSTALYRIWELRYEIHELERKPPGEEDLTKLRLAREELWGLWEHERFLAHMSRHGKDPLMESILKDAGKLKHEQFPRPHFRVSLAREGFPIPRVRAKDNYYYS